MRKLLLVALLTAGLAAPLAAQNAPAAKPADTKEDQQRAGIIFRTFTMAINSDKVQLPVKNQLVSCLYNNALRNVSVATGKVFAQNANLDGKNPQQIYAVAARVCGVKPAMAKAAPDAKTPTKTAQTSR